MDKREDISPTKYICADKAKLHVLTYSQNMQLSYAIDSALLGETVVPSVIENVWRNNRYGILGLQCVKACHLL